MITTIKAKLASWLLDILQRIRPPEQPNENDFIAYAREQARKESDPNVQVWPTQMIEPPEQPLALPLPIHLATVDIIPPPTEKKWKTGDLARAWHRANVVPTVPTGELQKPPDPEAFKDASWLNDGAKPVVSDETESMPAIKKLEIISRTARQVS